MKWNGFAITILIFLYLAGIVWFGLQSIDRNDGHLVYALDDAYIHMAMAKHLVQDGVFGISPYEFSSTTSSPLWTLLLAGSYAMFGVGNSWPMIWAVIFAVASLVILDRIGQYFGLNTFVRMLLLLVVLYLTPLIPLTFTGMEHTLHIFCVSAVLWTFLRYVEFPSRITLLTLCVVTGLATATRYESFFLLLPLLVVLLLKRRPVQHVALVSLAAALPVVIYGIISVSHGSFFLPNSLMIKGDWNTVTSLSEFSWNFKFKVLYKLYQTQLFSHLLILMLMTSLFARRWYRSLAWMSLAAAVVLFLHLLLARTGNFYRYEAYVIAIGVALSALALFSRLSELHGRATLFTGVRIIGMLFLGLLLLWPMHQRAADAHQNVVDATHNIFEQQVQMGQFLQQEFPPGSRVAVNDLGAVSYFADLKVLDLVGLGSIQVARAKREGVFTTATLEELFETFQIEYVIVYPLWFQGEQALPSSLIPVASWEVDQKIVVASRTVWFYGTSDAAAEKLRRAMQRYRDRLPEDVTFREIDSVNTTSESCSGSS